MRDATTSRLASRWAALGWLARGRRLVDVRAGEGRDVLFAFGTLLTFMIGHGVLETARDALFLTRLPPQRLPWVYLAMAVTGLGIVRLARYFRASGGRRLALTLVIGSACTVFLAWPAAAGSRGVAYVVYVWTGLVATMVTVQLWQMLGDRFTVEQAKRLFGVIGAGGVLGVAAGSALAASLADLLSPTGLLVVGGAFTAGAAVLPLSMRPPVETAAEVARPREDLPAPLVVVRTEPHARRLIVLALAATVTLTLVDYLFKSWVAASIEPGKLAAFFGRFYAGVNAVGLLIQVGVTAWLLRTVGATRGMALLPAAILAGGVAFVAAPVLAAIVAVKAVDGALRHSLQRTGFEVMFLPLPDGARRSLKGVVEMVGQRGGQALASAAILVGVSLEVGPRTLGLVLALLAGVWLVGTIGARRGYLDLFRARLRAGATDLAAALPDVDMAALEVLLVSLGSGAATEALSALAVLEQQNKAHLVPALLAYHPSREVCLRTLELLSRAGRRDAVPLVERLLASEDPERRAAALRAVHALAPERGVLETVADDESAQVRVMALVPMAMHAPGDREVQRRLREIVDGRDEDSQVALAGAIGAEPDVAWVPTLLALSVSPSEEVRVAVARASACVGDEALIAPLVDMLASRVVRHAARDALETFGSRALAYLGRALENPRTALPVRRHIPRTLARMPNSEAASVLVARLPVERDGMTRYKCLRALGAMKIQFPDLPLDRALLRGRVRHTLDRIVQILGWRVALASKPMHPDEDDLLSEFLRQKQLFAVERTFRLLGLLHSTVDLALVYDGLRRDDPKARAAGREILADSVEFEVRDALLVLTDDISDEDKLVLLRDRHAIVSPERGIEQMLSDRSEGVRLLAAHHRDAARRVRRVG
jgi:HEAT repeat protein